jgi:hypothetical protein
VLKKSQVKKKPNSLVCGHSYPFYQNLSSLVSLFSFLTTAGDTDQEDLASIASADIICTTPEKFDAMTRRHRARGGMRFFNEVRLCLGFLVGDVSFYLLNQYGIFNLIPTYALTFCDPFTTDRFSTHR